MLWRRPIVLAVVALAFGCEEAASQDAYSIERVQRVRERVRDDPDASPVFIFARFRWQESDQGLVASVHEPHCALNVGTRIGTVGLERSHAATGEQWQWGGMKPLDRLFTDVCRAGTGLPCSGKGCELPPSRLVSPRQL